MKKYKHKLTGKIFTETENKYYYFSDTESVPHYVVAGSNDWEPIKPFITEDKVEIFKGDKYWEVVLLNNNYSIRDMLSDTGIAPCRDYYITFSTEKAAKDWIELNKPQYSIKDIEKACFKIISDINYNYIKCKLHSYHN